MGDKGESHSGDGLVQSQVEKGVENHFSVNGGKREEGLLTTLRSIVGSGAKLVVVVSDRWPCTRGGEKGSLEIPSSNLTNPYLMRDELVRVIV